MDMKTYSATKTNFAAVADTLVLDVRELNTVLITYSGTYTFTTVFEGSDDGGTTWFPVTATMVNAATVATSHATTNATQAYELSCHAFSTIRLRCTAFTSAGTHRVCITGTTMAIEPAPVVQLAGTVTAGSTGNTTPGTTTTAVNSAASTNGASAKTTAAVLYMVTAHNTSAATKFVRFYNKSSAPTVGTDVPIVVMAIPANSSKEIDFGQVGMRFSSGLGHSITNGATALDSTAVAAGDVQLAYNWI